MTIASINRTNEAQAAKNELSASLRTLDSASRKLSAVSRIHSGYTTALENPYADDYKQADEAKQTAIAGVIDAAGVCYANDCTVQWLNTRLQGVAEVREGMGRDGLPGIKIGAAWANLL